MYNKHLLFFQNKRVKTSKYNQEIGSLKAENANIKSDIVRISYSLQLGFMICINLNHTNDFFSLNRKNESQSQNTIIKWELYNK